VLTWKRHRRRLLLLTFVASAGCAEPIRVAGLQDSKSLASATRNTGDRRPPLTVITREGDAQGAVAVAVTTDGVATDRGAMVGVALAALVQERLAGKGIEAVAVGGWSGWRLGALVGSPAQAALIIDAIRWAMLTPLSAHEPALTAVARKASALASRPLANRALVEIARCTGEPYGQGDDPPPSVAELESWRSASHGLGRIAIATAGSEPLADATARGLAQSEPWPAARASRPPAWPADDASTVVYDGSGELAPGGARIIVTARTKTAQRAVAAAGVLGNPEGPLASRLQSLEAPGHLRSVTATAHVDGGCLAATIDLSSRDLSSDPPGKIATAAALARQELLVQMTDVAAPADLGRILSTRASDPREAAERAAWWGLAGDYAQAAGVDLHVNLTVAVAASRDASDPSARTFTASVRTEIDRATLGFRAPVVQARTRVERGQGEVWILIGTPCGTLPEGPSDAGAGAAIALAAAAQASRAAGDAQVEPFTAVDGIGVLVHGPAHRGESPEGHARRLADVAARAFAADALQANHISQARTTLLLGASRADAQTLAGLANALWPAHPSWFDANGTPFGLATVSDETLALRAAAIRAGPLRVAVVSNVDRPQADAAVRAVDRWIARRPGESRVCPPTSTLAPPRSGTYALDRAAAAPSEALIAVPLPSGDAAARAAATWLAAALGGPSGLLARALEPSAPDAATPPPLSWSASVIGSPRAQALVVRVTAIDAALDGAVAQVRALVDRIRQGALGDEDYVRARAAVASTDLTASLDPRARAVELWRDEPRPSPPSLDAWREFAASALHDDALVILAARPGVDPAGRLSSHDGK